MTSAIDRPPWELAPPGVGPSNPVQQTGHDRRLPGQGQRRRPRGKTPEDLDNAGPEDGAEPSPKGEQRRVDIVA